MPNDENVHIATQMRTRSGATYAELIKRDKKREKRGKQIGIKPNSNVYLSARSIKNLKKIDALNRTLNEAAEYELPDSDSDSDTTTLVDSDSESSTNTLIEIPIANRISNKRTKMSDHLTKVCQLKMDGNLSENWRRFKRNFDIFMAAGNLNAQNNVIKINTFLNAVGEEAVEIFDSFDLTDVQRADYDAVVKSFADFCAPKKNTVYERFVFSQRQQKSGEPFDNFLIEIRRLVRTCDYGNMESEMLRDRIVQGVNEQRLQRELLATTNLTYDLAVTKCRSHEATNEQTSSMSKSVAVSQVEEKEYAKKNTQYRKSNNNKKQHTGTDKRNERRGQQQYKQTHNTQNRSNGNSSSNANAKDKSEKMISNCKYCGLSHKVRECPAYGKNCNSCLRKNHFSTVCRSKNVSAIDFDSSDNDEYFISSIERVYAFEDDDDEVSYPWIEKIWIDGKLVAFKIDTGAQINVLPLSIYKQLDTEIELHRTNTRLRAFSGDKVKPVGMCSLFGKFDDMSCKMKTAVVDFDIMPILGLQTAIDFGFVTPSAHSRVIKTRTFTNSSFKRTPL